MIQMQSELLVADNSGAQILECIKVLGGSKRRTASIGDIILGTVKKSIPGAKAKKGEMFRALIVRTKYPIHRSDGSIVRFDKNAVVLLNKQNEPVGTRVLGAVAREIRSISPFIWSLSTDGV